ncbi:MAG: hypothetical protein ACTHOD_13930 [Motilibacteraceae bacterium]
MSNPRPRPALRKSDDASLHPAAPRLEDREPALAASDEPSEKAAKQEKAERKQLVLELPKPLRKRLKAEAVTLGTTPADLAVEILERWADGGPTGGGRRRKG